MKTIRDFLRKNEAKLVLFIGFILVSGLSFEVGALSGQKWQQEPIVIEKQVNTAITSESLTVANSNASQSTSEVKSQALSSEPSASSCIYVGSKNSTKFYLSSCPWAKQIKPENIVCFKTQAEAISKGRTESVCKK